MKVRKILHIDDEAYEVATIRQALIEKGFQVDTFAWPEEAEDLNKEGSYSVLPEFEKYDLILLDMIMGPGDLGRLNTDEGYTTGLAFHEEKIATRFPGKQVFFVSALPDGPFRTKVMEYADKCKVPYIDKSADTVSQILRHIRILEAHNNENP